MEGVIYVLVLFVLQSEAKLLNQKIIIIVIINAFTEHAIYYVNISSLINQLKISFNTK